MDQQNPNNNPPRHVPTEAEIARLEAEAAAALQRGEPIPRREAPVEPQAEAPSEAPAAPSGFVPYVDDVPEPPTPRPESAETAEDDDDDEEYIPSEMEKRIDAMTPEQWKRWQVLGGIGVGIAVVVCLFGFGQELSTYGLLVGALLAIFLPRYLERSWRRKLNTARLAMIIAMVIGLAVMFLIFGLRNGFNFRAQ